ncbi:MAG: sulfotransferase [Steroidobacteraceae bacterium]
MSAPDGRLDETSLLEEARERTGLSDFGEGSFREPLAKLLEAIEREARLTPAGRAGQRTRIVGLLSARLQRQAWFTRHPEIEAERVDVRIVVVGFPRTGTTLLHRIWRRIRDRHGSPGGNAVTRRRCRAGRWSGRGARADPRIARAEAEVAAMIAGNPALAAVHPLDALAPDEDVMLLEHAFQSSPPAGLMNVPSYLRWHLAQDGRTAYDDHERFLRFLQWQKRTRRAGGPLRAQGATPYGASRSVAGALLRRRRSSNSSGSARATPLTREHGPRIAAFLHEGDTVHPSECADYALTTARCRLERTESVRQATGGQRFVDVWFGDIVTDALAVVERIYAQIGLDLPAGVRDRMARYVASHGRDKRPAHGYTLMIRSRCGGDPPGVFSLSRDLRAASSALVRASRRQ